MTKFTNPFDLSDRVAVITGGAGLLGEQHAAAIAAAGGVPVLVDIHEQRARDKAAALSKTYGVPAFGCAVDISRQEEIEAARNEIVSRFGRVDILINNAANNPKMEASSEIDFSRLENFPLSQWDADLAVGLTGAFLCSKVFGTYMAANGGGVIVNVASDLALIGPDQRIYRQPDLPDHLQPVKPVTYSVVKSALVGLTRYLATYWATQKVRVNAISPGGVENGQPPDFVERLTNLIPMGRMAVSNEYQGAIVFLCSDASSYMTGANLVIDGGRSCW
ncbi:3-oxoacyl-[acyl-carrier protein] reductase [Acidisarcina polymorpha]|uniref:3-oxoacyl-[acyl-carrier protein] reductase n=1 Tax=Acidisarcina polymorpha TaxID=2211140 RepID=A0A2Z5FYI7_9BACT|nr:SDR family oxidoreductase [Acidisarcina polymorpha]AXC11527.1 3-oxoacyl-[acyl-carrier protein] reductase [Acidisarcina polymorpha]